MAIDPRKRQKKLERRTAKQKAERREVARCNAGGLAGRLQGSSAAPILHCCVATDVWQHGIRQVLVSRQLPAGQVAFASFLVDIYCLGVKDVVMSVAPLALYLRNMYEKLAARSRLIPIKPECARKLVEGAVQYAMNVGLSPHADYRTAKLIFGDVSAADCRQQFTFGEDGKPFFVGGPYDSPARCEQIIRTLHDHCGPDGYHYAIPGGEVAGPPWLSRDKYRVGSGAETSRIIHTTLPPSEAREEQ